MRGFNLNFEQKTVRKRQIWIEVRSCRMRAAACLLEILVHGDGVVLGRIKYMKRALPEANISGLEDIITAIEIIIVFFVERISYNGSRFRYTSKHFADEINI